MNATSPLPFRPQKGGAGDILALFRGGLALTRNDVVRSTGLSRSTVSQRIDMLLRSGYLRQHTDEAATGGRPANRYTFNPDAGHVLVAAVGASHFSAVLAAFDAEPEVEVSGAIDIADGPETVMPRIETAFQELLSTRNLAASDIQGIAVSVPGPVEFAQGRVVNPPIMTGWDNFSIPDWFTDRFQCPVLVENDANAMAYGEFRASFPRHPNMLLIKIGTGIGCGIVMGGTLHRGAQGAAGDIGHVRAGVEWIGEHPVPCCCGNVGCVEAYASGWAMIRDLTAAGVDIHTNEDVVSLIRSGDSDAMRLIRRSARICGQAIADAVSFFNPSLVLIGGYYTKVDELLLAGIREIVYRRSLPLATKYLQILASPQGGRAGTLGLCHLLTEHILSPEAIDRALQTAP